MKFRDLFDKKTWLPDWEKIFSIKEFKDMKNCEQSKIWHAEGNVDVHTKMVCQSMYSLLLNRENIEPSDNDYYIMMMSAAICHDLGKPSTTKFDKEKGDFSTKCHGQVGANITRKLFYDEDFELREKVCYMVRWHMTLHHIFDKEEKATRKMIQLSHGRVSVKDMLILNICDSLGSKNKFENEAFLTDKENRIKSLAIGLNCYETPYKFNNEYDKIRFFHFKDKLFPEGYSLPSDYGQFTMYVMIGIPGSGKSYYIENNLKDVVQVSRDLIRSEMGIPGEKPQGTKKQEKQVTELFIERMLECCKNKQDFVIDNTNVRKMYRDTYTDIAMKFMPKIVYIYVEAPSLDVNKSRRNGMMPLGVIDNMWNQFDFPELTECNEFIAAIQK